MRIAVLLSNIFGRERRKVDEPVKVERRGPRLRVGLKESQDRASKAIEELEQTVRLRQEDFHECSATNDRQQVVLFHTFQEICRFRGPDAIKVRICRHPRHEDAKSTQLATCEESHCPVMNEALAGVHSFPLKRSTWQGA